MALVRSETVRQGRTPNTNSSSPSQLNTPKSSNWNDQGSFSRALDAARANNDRGASKYILATQMAKDKFSEDPDVDRTIFRNSVDDIYNSIKEDGDMSAAEVRGENPIQQAGRAIGEGIDTFNKGIGSGLDWLFDNTVGNLVGAFDSGAGEWTKNLFTGEDLSLLPDMAEDILLSATGWGIPLVVGKNLAQRTDQIAEGLSGRDSITGEKLDSWQQLGKLGEAGLGTFMAAVPGIGKAATKGAEALTKGQKSIEKITNKAEAKAAKAEAKALKEYEQGFINKSVDEAVEKAQAEAIQNLTNPTVAKAGAGAGKFQQALENAAKNRATTSAIRETVANPILDRAAARVEPLLERQAMLDDALMGRGLKAAPKAAEEAPSRMERLQAFLANPVQTVRDRNLARDTEAAREFIERNGLDTKKNFEAAMERGTDTTPKTLTGKGINWVRNKWNNRQLKDVEDELAVKGKDAAEKTTKEKLGEFRRDVGQGFGNWLKISGRNIRNFAIPLSDTYLAALGNYGVDPEWTQTDDPLNNLLAPFIGPMRRLGLQSDNAMFPVLLPFQTLGMRRLANKMLPGISAAAAMRKPNVKGNPTMFTNFLADMPFQAARASAAGHLADQISGRSTVEEPDMSIDEMVTRFNGMRGNE